MSEVDEFLSVTIPRQIEEERALQWRRCTATGDVVAERPGDGVRALRSDTGWHDTSNTFRIVASHLSNCTSFEFELVAAGASGDLAYTVGYEHIHSSWDGVPRPWTLRVTHVYRREAGK